MPPIKFDYLRLLEDGAPAAGKFEGWPDKTSEVTSLDPCMGSGHFIASLFSVFVALRMYEEGLSKEEATDKVISENLHGLELDPRCTQLAAFNLALTAWKFCGHYKELPEMNLACSGIAPKGKMEDWIKLVGKVERAEDKTRMENGMRMIYAHFQLAPELGSLLDPTTIKADTFTASFEELEPVLRRALENEADEEQVVRGVMAAGIAKTGQLLSKKYTLQITNVPYLGKKKQDKILATYTSENYSAAKSDLATVFLERLQKTSKNGGIICSVMPQNWLFLTTYKKFRESLLKKQAFNFVILLGEHAFENSEAGGAFASIVSISNKIPPKDHSFFGINAANNRGERPIYSVEKIDLMKVAQIKTFIQTYLLKNPDSRILFQEIVDLPKLTAYSETGTGLQSFDSPHFIFAFWELKQLINGWLPLQSAPLRNSIFSGMSGIIKWQQGKGELFELMRLKEKDGYKSGIWKAGSQFWGKRGLLHSVMTDLPMSIYLGFPYDTNAAVIIPKEEKYLMSIFAFSQSGEFSKSVRAIDQKLMVTNSTFVKVPFDIDYWQKVAVEKYPNGLPKPYSDDPSQWLFHGHPIKSDNPLQVALARLLGYRWPAESDTEMELSEDGRELIADVKVFDDLSDDDGILCIPSVNMEHTGADRLRDYLQTIWGSEWTNQTIYQLLQVEDARSNNLEEWLRNEFFSQHCKVFQNRPFIWHIWDGRKDGFSALVNYHKLTKDNLSKLIYTYLGDWIRMCEAKKRAGESGAEGLLSAARDLKVKLEAILEGEAPYDIFVRWKPFVKQPIGWDPDLNDGVRLNIRPFMEAKVLRKLPNIKWGIDRGKNPPGSPWGVIRDNDRHLTLEEKRKAIGINQ